MTKVKAKGYLWKGSYVSDGKTYDAYMVTEERNPNGGSNFHTVYRHDNHGWEMAYPAQGSEITGFVELERNYELKQVNYNHAKGNRIILDTPQGDTNLEISDATDDFVPDSPGAEYVFMYSVYDYDTDEYIGKKVIKRIVGETYETPDGQQWVFNGHWSGKADRPGSGVHYIEKEGGYWVIRVIYD